MDPCIGKDRPKAMALSMATPNVKAINAGTTHELAGRHDATKNARIN